MEANIVRMVQDRAVKYKNREVFRFKNKQTKITIALPGTNFGLM